MVITGAHGYIARKVSKQIELEGKSVHAYIYRSTRYYTQLEQSRSSAIWCDLAQSAEVDAALQDIRKHMPDENTIIHLAGKARICLASGGAGYVRPNADRSGIIDNYQNNVVITANVLESAIRHGYKHLIFASSQSVYGWNAATGITTEDTSVDPIEYYAASKVACEEMLRAASKHIAITVLRISGVFGGDRKNGLVAQLIKQAHVCDRIQLVFEYPIPMDIVHVEDVASAILLAADRQPIGYRVYNIASGESCSPRIIAERIALIRPGTQIMEEGVPCPIVHISNELAHKELNWQPYSLNMRLQQEGA